VSNPLVKQDPLEKANAIVVLTGNGWERTDFAVELYKKGWAPLLVVVGSTGSRPSLEMAKFAEQQGVPKEDTIIENKSRNTRQNAENVLHLAKQYNWEKIILVTSSHHQLRAHLTFKKTMANLGITIKIINSPSLASSCFDRVETSRNKNKTVFRFWYFFSECYRLIKYRIKGDL